MARYYRRRSRRTFRRRALKASRYSVETSVCAGVINPQGDLTTQYRPFVPQTNIQGVRKVKNITLDFVLQTDAQLTFGWALVYWPQFDEEHMLYTPALAEPVAGSVLSLYEPNQNVIMQGIFNTTNSKQFRRFTALSRNLNSEDTLMLLIRPYTINPNWGGQEIHYAFTVKYAITF